MTPEKTAAIRERAELRTCYILAFNDANPTVPTPSLVYTGGWWVFDDRGTRSRVRTAELCAMTERLLAMKLVPKA